MSKTLSECETRKLMSEAKKDVERLKRIVAETNWLAVECQSSSGTPTISRSRFSNSSRAALRSRHKS
jgi:hypothetical protein